MMRTTLTIDDEVYIKVKHLAETQNYPIGEVVSELLKKGLEKQLPKIEDDDFPVIPTRKTGRKITNEFINQLRDEEGI